MNTKFEYAKFLIRVFLKEGQTINYAKEIKIANKLLSQFPDSRFWADQQGQFNKLNSLAFFLIKENNLNLIKSYNLFQSDKTKKLNVNNYTLQENTERNTEVKKTTSLKPKTILDFLDNK